MTKKTKLTLTPEQQSVLDSFSAEEKKDFNAMESEDQLSILNEILAAQADTEKLSNEVETVDGIKTESGRKLAIAGGLVIRKGLRHIAQFVGLEYVFSREKKENWEHVPTQDGKDKMYRSKAFIFRRTDGTEFGVFFTPMMGKALRNVLTNTSGGAVATDPVVDFTYLGKISREDAEKDYDFKMDTGSETHAWDIKVEKNARRGTGKGYLNQLNAPLPIGGGDDEDLTQDEINMRNYRESSEMIANRPSLSHEGAAGHIAQ